jgi:hypothetical protein
MFANLLCGVFTGAFWRFGVVWQHQGSGCARREEAVLTQQASDIVSHVYVGLLRPARLICCVLLVTLGLGFLVTASRQGGGSACSAGLDIASQAGCWTAMYIWRYLSLCGVFLPNAWFQHQGRCSGKSPAYSNSKAQLHVTCGTAGCGLRTFVCLHVCAGVPTGAAAGAGSCGGGQVRADLDY